MPEGDRPTDWAPEHEPYDTVLRGSLPLPSELLDNWDPSPWKIGNYRGLTVALSARLPFAIGWLVEDQEWAMGLVRGVHGH